MAAPLPSDPQRLSEQLEEVSRREAWFRARTAQQVLALESEVKTLRARAQALSDELGERNTYIHALHLERDERKRAADALWHDLSIFTELLAAAEAERDAARRDALTLRRSWGWTLAAPLRALQRAFGPRVPAGPATTEEGLPGYDFLYYLHTPPFRIYRGEEFRMRGWVMPRDGREVTAIRVRIAGREFFATRDLEEPEVVQQHGAQSKNPRPGFEVTFATPPGRHVLQLEAQLESAVWFSILTTPIWVQRNR